MTAPEINLPSWSWPRLLALVFAPGLALAVFVLITAPLLAVQGLPQVWAVLGGVLLVLVPAQVALVRRYRPPGRVLSRGTLQGWPGLTVGMVTALACAVLPAAGLPLEEVIPGWADVGLGSLAQASAPVAGTTMVLWLVAVVFVGPVVEEAWFRGCVQPRIPGGPWAVPLRSAALFAAYHLWQPQAVLTVFLFALPLCLLVHRTRATGVAAVVHVAVNALTAVGSVAGVLNR